MTEPRRPETTSRVADQDWTLDDLTGATAEHVEYVRVDLAETTSTAGVVFEDCTFREVGFDLARHTGAAFLNCTFTGCSFVGATFTSCKFIGSRFQRCGFERLTVDGGDWSFTTLTRADLRAASFDGVRMREAELAGVNATGGVLRAVDLSAANLHDAVLDRCDLRGCDLSALDPGNVSLRGSIITWEQAIVLAAGFGLDVRPD